MEQQVVSGIAYAKDEAKVTLLQIEDKPGVAASIFGPLAEANINVDMIVQNLSSDGKRTDMTFTVQESELQRASSAKVGQEGDRLFRGEKLLRRGQGVRDRRRHAQPCRRGSQMFKALAEKGINILAITTSEIKISVLIDAAYAELAVRTLHALYGLGKD